jgi:hypothetical protein
VFGDGTVILKAAPGHTQGHQVLYVKLARTGGVLLSGDLFHYAAERQLGKLPTFEVDREQTRASRQEVEAFLERTGAILVDSARSAGAPDAENGACLLRLTWGMSAGRPAEAGPTIGLCRATLPGPQRTNFVQIWCQETADRGGTRYHRAETEHAVDCLVPNAPGGESYACKGNEVWMNSPALVIAALLLAALAGTAQAPSEWRPEIPRVWDEAALADWATPLAGLNVRPTHLSPDAYYALPEENLRTYPVYLPGREPEGYWETIQSVRPTPLIEPEALKSKDDWIRAGERVFRDSVVLRTFDPKIIAMARDARSLAVEPLPDGTVNTLRWLPTKDGVALAFANCGGCHMLYLPPDHRAVPGASSFASIGFRNGLGGQIRAAERVLPGEAPFNMGGPVGSWLYQAYGAPWTADPHGERLKSMTEADLQRYVTANFRGGAVARWNGSILYPAKVPDLIGVQERKYIDHTGTHQHRGIGDLMRYAALVSFAETTEFGPYRVLETGTRRFQTRLPDAALYAMALYVYSLEPPPNPNRFDERAAAGEQIFQREGCASCHTPPLYTSNKLTLAQGFVPPSDTPGSLDILRLSVGTDPGLALKTRKGTGYYKVPSLKGLWYRGYYLHDGAVSSLEELFDPGRVKDTHTPGGWRPPGVERREVPGHEFGLRLSPTERERLIAFLRTL